MPLNHSYTHFYQLLWKRVSQLPSPYILTSPLSVSPSQSLALSLSSSLSLSLSLSWPSDWMQQYNLWGVTIYIEEVVKTQFTTSTNHDDCLQRRSHWWYDAPTSAPAIPILYIHKNYNLNPVCNVVQWNHVMLKEHILTIHLTLSWCFPYYSRKLRHQYLPGFKHLGHFICALLFKHDKTAQQMAGSSQ